MSTSKNSQNQYFIKINQPDTKEQNYENNERFNHNGVRTRSQKRNNQSSQKNINKKQNFILQIPNQIQQTQNVTKTLNIKEKQILTKNSISISKSGQKNGIQRQVKLNFYIQKIKANTSHNDSSSLGNSKFAISQFQRKKSLLQNELKQKDELIDKLKNQRQNYNQKYNKLRIDYQLTKQNNKKVLQNQLRERAQFLRKQKAAIQPNYGYYKQNSWTVFIQGIYLKKAKAQVQNVEKQIQNLQSRKRNSRQEEKERLTYQIQFLKKNKEQYTQRLRKRQVEVSHYKDRLRLAQKQSSCTFAQLNWPLLNQRFLPMQLLGSGGFGQVYKCYDLQKNTYVALKTNCFEPTKHPENKQEFVKHVKREVEILKNLNHPNIAKLIQDISIQNDKISFILQYCSGPELNKYLAKNGHLDEKQAKGIIKQIVFALKYMYQQKNKIIHYDLKPANIIFHNGTVKILDFGLCKKMQTEQTKMDLTSQGVGTYWYLPPQTFKNHPQISSKVDIWSLGVIFYQLLYGRKPFGHGISQNKLMNQGIILKAFHVQFPAQKKFKVSQQAKSLIRQCLAYDAEQRIDPDKLYNHPYLHH